MIEKDKIYITPGYICVPHNPTLLCGVIGSGVVVTLFDSDRHCGGAAYFILPQVPENGVSTPYFAIPAVSGLIALMKNNGSKIENLEAHIYGGAENKEHPRFVHGLGLENVKIAQKLFFEKEITIAGMDTGGTKGRKIIFNTGSGDIIAAKVKGIRLSDWYPKPGEKR